MAPATLFPSTIRDYVHKNYLHLKTVNNRNLLIIPDETKIQEAYKRGDTTSDNNAFCAFKKQLCEYGFSVVARKDWIDLGLDLNITWVYEHPSFNRESCEKCDLRKPCKPITVRFQINPETGDIEWINSSKTVMHGQKLINCIRKTMFSSALSVEPGVSRKRSLKSNDDQDLLGKRQSEQKKLKKSLSVSPSNFKNITSPQAQKNQVQSDSPNSCCLIQIDSPTSDTNSILPINVQASSSLNHNSTICPDVNSIGNLVNQVNVPTQSLSPIVGSANLGLPNYPCLSNHSIMVSENSSVFPISPQAGANQYLPTLTPSNLVSKQPSSMQNTALDHSNYQHFLIPHVGSTHSPINPILQLIPMIVQSSSISSSNAVNIDDITKTE